MDTTDHSQHGGKLTRLLTSPAREGDQRLPLDDTIRRLRQRWRLRRVLHGLVRVLALAAIVFVVNALILDQTHFAPAAVWSLRFAMLVVLVGALLQFCVKPLRVPLSDARVALYFEEHEPGLGGIVVGAVDARDSAREDLSPQLVERLLERAADASADIDYGDRIEQPELKRQGLLLTALVILLVGLAVWQPLLLRQAAPALLMPWTQAAQYSPYEILLSPGDIEIARGADQLISATIEGFDGDGVTLHTSNDGGDNWRQVQMALGNREGLYETFLFDLADDIDYYVTGAGQESPIFRITVADIPAIDRIELRYQFPAYTRLEPVVSEGSGDITALRGTRVEIAITPTIDIPGGALVFADGREIPLAGGGREPWRAEILVETDSSYHVTLQRSSGIAVDASAEFRIVALDDLQPNVSILSPGRDIKVSMIEEPLMKIRADDDQGIADLELVLSINGDEEQVIPLLRDDALAHPNRQVEAEHVVYLEDLDLRPGDLISYYVNARDRAPGTGAKTATSDIFFYQVRPFDTNYRRAEQGGGGGGGGGGAQGGQQGGFLSEQQKQFVVATFKMIRDRDDYDDATYRENLELLAKAEGRIRDRVQAIVRRIGSRALIQVDERYKTITEELPQAIERMFEVEKKLRRSEVEAALGDAQVALKHLQRADAVFRDINVSLSNRNGGGSGQSAGFEDLANLFQLEMDKLRNQYDSVQRAQQQQSPEAMIDETLEKLRELARRQQREIERQLRSQGQAATEQSRERQLELARQLEEMARQLERLSRNQSNPRLQQSAEQMRRAAEAMRQAANNQGGGRDSLQQARRAGENLQEAERLLDQNRSAQFSEAVKRTLKRAELVEKKQQAIREDVNELEEIWSEKLKQQLQRLDDRKAELTRELNNLENEINQLTAEARQEQPAANESLKQAIRAAREYRLNNRIARTREMILINERDAARDNEEQIQQGIGRMRENIESALAQVTEPGERDLERSLEQMRSLARELQYLRERGQNGNRGGRGQSRGGQATAVDGESDQPPRQELENIVERSGQLRNALVSQGVSASDVETLMEKIEALTAAGAENHGQAQELALRALMELEFKLRRQLESHEYPELLITDTIELPPEYQQMVADYFRELSRQ